jgi:hypothetical protein
MKHSLSDYRVGRFVGSNDFGDGRVLGGPLASTVCTPAVINESIDEGSVGIVEGLVSGANMGPPNVKSDEHLLDQVLGSGLVTGGE